MKPYDVREFGSSSSYGAGEAVHVVYLGIEVPRDQEKRALALLKGVASVLREAGEKRRSSPMKSKERTRK